MKAFRYEENTTQYYNLLFPLAGGNLKQLFRGSLRNASVKKPSQALWTQFEGLASALAYLHDECSTAHRDIKPSNILLYEATTRPKLVAKIADFGLAVTYENFKSWEPGTAEADSAWKYDAPEVRAFATEQSGPTHPFQTPLPNKASFLEPNIQALLPKQLQRADIWKLGAVFTELLTFLVQGENGVTKFRNFIFVTQGNFTTKEFDDSRFDDGVKVKDEVIEWLSRMEAEHSKAHEIVSLARLMLAQAEDRPSAAFVSDSLRKVILR